MFALILLSLVAVSFAQFPTRCESPKQWEARRYRVDREKKFQEIAFHAYDEINLRTRSVEEVQEGISKEYYDKIHLHGENKQYTINLKTRQCNVTVPTHPFRPIGVPPEAKFMFEAEAGPVNIPNEHLTAQVWAGNFSDGAQFSVSVTYPDCVPLTFDVKLNSSVPEYFHERYFDLRGGISDPERFIPPPECAGL